MVQLIVRAGESILYNKVINTVCECVCVYVVVCIWVTDVTRSCESFLLKQCVNFMVLLFL